VSAARRLHVAPSPDEILRVDIAAICAQIDMRLGNPPGTAERGTYFWHWPPHDGMDLEVLARLHADAAALLFTITNPTPEVKQ